MCRDALLELPHNLATILSVLYAFTFFFLFLSRSNILWAGNGLFCLYTLFGYVCDQCSSGHLDFVCLFGFYFLASSTSMHIHPFMNDEREAVLFFSAPPRTLAISHAQGVALSPLPNTHCHHHHHHHHLLSTKTSRPAFSCQSSRMFLYNPFKDLCV